MVTSFCKKDAIAPNIQNIISKYSITVPMPSKNERTAVRILNNKLIGNKMFVQYKVSKLLVQIFLIHTP